MIIKLNKLCFVFGFVLLSSITVDAQKNELKEYNKLINTARNYDKVNFYVQEGQTLKKAIALAKKNKWEEKRLSALIDLAELKRKTRDFRAGIEILRSLENTEEYPLQHLRKLGRLASTYSELPEFPLDIKVDSVRFFLNKAIPLAEQYNFEATLASLKNQKACLEMNESDKELSYSINLLQEAAKIFHGLNDTHNLAIVLNHTMECYHRIGKIKTVDSLNKVITAMIKDKNWYQTKTDFFGLVSKIALENGDSLGWYKWRVLAKSNTLKYMEAAFKNQMASFRVLYDVEKYQNQSAKKAKEVILQKSLNTKLALYLSALAILLLGIVGLLLRERKFKQELNTTNEELQTANDKYEMLLVESNHRIKNNLQMIISMLQYAEDVDETENSAAFQRLSGKIQTVSALHKHLYLDAHNEKVNMVFYFMEIIDLYERLSSEQFTVNYDINEKIEIPSERLVYFGLILNEMISNTIEHHTTEYVHVFIHVKSIDNHFLFCYQDGSCFLENNNKGTGSLLIEELINRVEGFNLLKDNTKGKYEFEFYV